MISYQLKELRKNSGISQTELANALGVTKQSVSNWENDNILPSIEMLIKIAEYFNVSTDYLLGRSNNHYLITDGLSELQISHIQMIINDFSSLNVKIMQNHNQ